MRLTNVQGAILNYDIEFWEETILSLELFNIT